MMNLKSISTYVAFATGGVLALASAPAQAFTFTTNFTPNNPNPKSDIFLQSVVVGGNTISDFSYINSVSPFTNVSGRNTLPSPQLFNQQWVTTNAESSGAASSERGDNASGVKAEVATPASLVASLGNNNLNNIVDTEDQGSFRLNMFFESAVDTLFFWERGMNSKLGVQAIDLAGNLLGNVFLIDSSSWSSAGFHIDTTEVARQRVGSYGLTTEDLGVSGPIAGIQLTAMGRSYNGPDFKVVGASTAVPEPATIAGLGLVAGAMAARRRRKVAKQA